MGFISQEYSFNASMEDVLFVKSLKQHSFANYTLKQRENKRRRADWNVTGVFAEVADINSHVEQWALLDSTEGTSSKFTAT